MPTLDQSGKMRKNREKKNTYSRLQGCVFRPWPMVYSSKQKIKILRPFPKEHHDDVLREISECVSILVGRLKSSITPTNVKRSEGIKELKSLENQFISSLETLNELLAKSASYGTIEFKRALCQLTQGKITVAKVSDRLLCCKLACQKALKAFDAPGHKNPHFRTAIKNLHTICWKYTGEKPTRHSIQKKTYPYGQKDEGPFYRFLDACIIPALRQAEIPIDDVSIHATAKEVMAKI